jgi:ribonucleotide monophosphatase NagD (HAD superfamily)
MGREILRKRMSLAINEVIFFRNLGESQAKMCEQRRNNTMQALTWSETLRSTQNFAKYVNEKKKVRGDSK